MPASLVRTTRWRANCQAQCSGQYLRSRAVALIVGDDFAALLLPDADTAVGGSKVDAYGGPVDLLSRHAWCALIGSAN